VKSRHNKKNKTKKLPLNQTVVTAGILLVLAVLTVFTFQGKPYNGSSLKPLTLQHKSNSPLTPTPTAAEPTKKPTVSLPQHYGNQLRVPILMYHYVGNNPNPKDSQRDTLSISPDKFQAQVKYLKDNGYSTISLDTLYAALKNQATLPAKPIILTFDDGYIDFYVNAYPILKSYNSSATVFVITGFVGQNPYLTWPQITEMAGSGLISFEAHTVHHSNLPSLSDEAALYELSESKKNLEQMVGIPVNFIAYPFGATDQRIMDLTKRVGFLGGVGTWPDKIQSEGVIYDLPRERINGSVDLENFISRL
jgi:peptidoglycan/xylan/chitin deacetylase (PgdA/CDA1 family)